MEKVLGDTWTSLCADQSDWSENVVLTLMNALDLSSLKYINSKHQL
jgi:hypothetical protein